MPSIKISGEQGKNGEEPNTRKKRQLNSAPLYGRKTNKDGKAKMRESGLPRKVCKAKLERRKKGRKIAH